MVLRLQPPSSGYDLKLEVLTHALAWELYGDDVSKEQGELLIEDEQLEFASKVAGKALAVLDEFKEE